MEVNVPLRKQRISKAMSKPLLCSRWTLYLSRLWHISEKIVRNTGGHRFSQEYRHPSLLFAQHVGHERLLGKHLLVGYKVYITWNSSLLLELLKKLGEWAAQGSLVLVSMAAQGSVIKHTLRSSTRTQQFDGNANWLLSLKKIQHNGYRLPGSERHFITRHIGKVITAQVSHAFNRSTGEAKADRSLWIHGHSGEQSETLCSSLNVIAPPISS